MQKKKRGELSKIQFLAWIVASFAVYFSLLRAFTHDVLHISTDLSDGLVWMSIIAQQFHSLYSLAWRKTKRNQFNLPITHMCATIHCERVQFPFFDLFSLPISFHSPDEWERERIKSLNCVYMASLSCEERKWISKLSWQITFIINFAFERVKWDKFYGRFGIELPDDDDDEACGCVGGGVEGNKGRRKKCS